MQINTMENSCMYLQLAETQNSHCRPRLVC